MVWRCFILCLMAVRLVNSQAPIQPPFSQHDNSSQVPTEGEKDIISDTTLSTNPADVSETPSDQFTTILAEHGFTETYSESTLVTTTEFLYERAEPDVEETQDTGFQSNSQASVMIDSESKSSDVIQYSAATNEYENSPQISFTNYSNIYGTSPDVELINNGTNYGDYNSGVTENMKNTEDRFDPNIPKLFDQGVVDSSGDREHWRSRNTGNESTWSSSGSLTSTITGHDCMCYNRTKTFIECRNCSSFPSEVDEIPFTEFKLSGTSMEVIRRADFQNYGNLTSLMIEGNVYLKEIEPNSFSTLKNLIRLSISSNSKLARLDPYTFVNLKELKMLTLSNNDFTSFSDFVAALSPRILPNLQILNVSGNSIYAINDGDLQPMDNSQVVLLNLAYCNILSISPTSLRPLKHLQTLILSQNLIPITGLTALIQQLTKDGTPLRYLNLMQLDISLMQLEGLLTVIGKSDVTDLILESNRIPDLRMLHPLYMPKLVFLNLKDNRLRRINAGIFTKSSFPSLQYLRLSHNDITEFSIALPQLKQLDLSGNAEPPMLMTLNRNSFNNLTSLDSLFLYDNNLKYLRSSNFKGLESLTNELDLSNCFLENIEEGTFASLRRLKCLNLSSNPSLFSNHNPTSEIFSGLVALETLNLENCGIRFIKPDAFAQLTSLKRIVLSNNIISYLSPDIFRPLAQLELIDLSFNRIEAWTTRLFENNTKLKTIFLDNNYLTAVTSAMISDFSMLTYLSISNNSLNCRSLTALQENVPNADRLQQDLSENMPQQCPFLSDPSDSSGGTFYNLKQSEWIGIGALILGVTALGTAAYVYRSYMRYWFFLARMDMRRRGFLRNNGANQPLEGYANYQYDAFVSYSSEDRNFVLRLVYMLETFEPRLKLCVYERDFQIGSMITEAVLESVALSRRTVLIISDAFARSQWCRWEMEMARNYRLFLEDASREDPLVLIKLGDVAPSRLTPTLRYLLRTRIYLEWDPEPRKQRLFWDKLRTTLAPPNVVINP